MELGHCARLIGLKVLQVKTPDQVVITPYMFRHQMYLYRSQVKITGICFNEIPPMENILNQNEPFDELLPLSHLMKQLSSVLEVVFYF